MNDLPGALYLLLIPMLAAIKSRPRTLDFALAWAALSVPFWASTHALVRMNPILLVAAALASAVVLVHLRTLGLGMRWLSCAVVGALVFANTAWTFVSADALLREPLRYLVGRLDRDAFLAHAFELYPAFRFANETLDDDSVVFLATGDARVAYLRKRAVLSGRYARPAIHAQVIASADANALLESIRAQGATHIVLTPNLFSRLGRSGWGDWTPAQRARYAAFVRGLGPPLFADKHASVFALPERLIPQATAAGPPPAVDPPRAAGASPRPGPSAPP